MRAITGGEKYVEALNKNWHSLCFSCNVSIINPLGDGHARHENTLRNRNHK